MIKTFLPLLTPALLLLTLTPRALSQMFYAVATDADPKQLDIPPLTRGTPGADRTNNTPGDLLLQIDFTTHKRHYLANRPHGMLQAVTFAPNNIGGAQIVVLSRVPTSKAKDPDAAEPDAGVAIFSSAGNVEHRFVVPSSVMRIRSAPQLLPTKGRLLFARSLPTKDPKIRVTPSEIVTSDLNGGDIKVLAPGLWPVWSPNGQTIVFTAPAQPNAAGDAAHYRVMAMDSTGSHIRPIGAPDTCDGAFSPDGKKIVYLKLGPGRTDVVIANADGSSPHKITGLRTPHHTPRWLDNSRIVVAANIEAMSPVALNTPKATPKPAPPAIPDSDTTPGSPALPDGLFVLAIDGSVTRRIFPAQAIDIAIDRTRIDTVQALIDGGIQDLDNDPQAVPGRIPWPKQTKPRLVVQGDKLFIKDDFGRLKPAPNGFYILPDGHRAMVRGGKMTITK